MAGKHSCDNQVMTRRAFIRASSHPRDVDVTATCQRREEKQPGRYQEARGNVESMPGQVQVLGGVVLAAAI
jgi:hypothetical protein